MIKLQPVNHNVWPTDAVRILTNTAMLVPIQSVSIRAATEVGTKGVLTLPALTDALHLHTLIDVWNTANICLEETSLHSVLQLQQVKIKIFLFCFEYPILPMSNLQFHEQCSVESDVQHVTNTRTQNPTQVKIQAKTQVSSYLPAPGWRGWVGSQGLQDTGCCAPLRHKVQQSWWNTLYCSTNTPHKVADK